MKRIILLSLGVLSVLSGPLTARGTINDALSFALEAAFPNVKEGFTVRVEHWGGDLPSGQPKPIPHQLFKGNEYAFWLGTANEDCKLDLQVLDEAGKPVHIDFEQDKGGMFASVRVNPPKTGTYAVVFALKSKTETGVFWAVAYGYR